MSGRIYGPNTCITQPICVLRGHESRRPSSDAETDEKRPGDNLRGKSTFLVSVIQSTPHRSEYGPRDAEVQLQRPTDSSDCLRVQVRSINPDDRRKTASGK
ncbi:unnamed protein product [Caenorhabditis auriculariae]|uniref:Uncharacterized protein n=1 Tax=Caenorhabditis auriculariae TaxID=2777116 RepID=A0A8S1H296_9PELO|nr:unnamed protein product [Caenorhabditis auriculariae]